jgi:replication-associated recombination protein RarA
MEVAKKYTPTNLGEVVFPNQTVKTRIKAYASNSLSGDLMLWGPNGTSKTTVANLLPYLIGGENPYIERDPDSLLKEVDLKAYLSQASHNASLFNTSPIVFLLFHEFDDAKGTMSKLWKALDEVNEPNRQAMLIVTTNNPMQIHQSLLARFDDVEFPKVKVMNFLRRAQHILQQEGVDLPDQQVIAILKTVESYGNLRKYCKKLDEIIYLHSHNLPIPSPCTPTTNPRLSVVSSK